MKQKISSNRIAIVWFCTWVVVLTGISATIFHSLHYCEIDQLEDSEEFLYYPKEGSFHLNKDTLFFYFGEIDNSDLYVKMRNTIIHFKDKKIKTLVFDLNSPGGDEDTANIIVIYINLLKKQGIHVITYVGPDHECASACTGIFAAGDQRVASPTADFTFHYGTASGTDLEGQAPQDFVDQEKYYANIMLGKQIFEICGNNNKISKIILDPKNISFSYTPKELKDICPNYVTQTIN